MPDISFPSHDRILRYREDYKGDIVHLSQSTGSLVKREPCTKKSLDRLIRFMNQDYSEDYQLLGQFNVVGEDLVRDITGFDIAGQAYGDFMGIVAKGGDRKPSKRIARSGEHFTVSVRKENDFKANSRYRVERTGQTILFHYLEPISSDNLNQQYGEPIFSVYVCEKNLAHSSTG